MNISDYIHLSLFTGLLKFRTVRYAAMTILAGYAVYFTSVIPLADEYYYHATGLLNLVIGLFLFPRFKLVALLSFLLIVVNNVGLMMYELGYEPALYNNLSQIIIIIQLLLLYIRALLDGQILRGTRGRALVWLVNADCIQSSATLLQKKKEGTKK